MIVKKVSSPIPKEVVWIAILWGNDCKDCKEIQQQQYFNTGLEIYTTLKHETWQIVFEHIFKHREESWMHDPQ